MEHAITISMYLMVWTAMKFVQNIENKISYFDK